MRQIIYLVFGENTHASFTADEKFNVDMWAAIHNQLLIEAGVTGIEVEDIDDDDFRLEGEIV